MRKKQFIAQIRFHFIAPASLPERTAIKDVVAEIGKHYKMAGFTVAYIFCDDSYLLDINRRFLNHDYFTDVVSFDLSSQGGMVEGEVYISVDRVRENAGELNVPMYLELVRVIFHGALHLCGVKDKLPKEILKMRAEEDRYMLRLKSKLFHVKQKRKKRFT